MQSAKLPPASAIGTSTTDTSANLTPNDLRTTSPYLFYPNLTNHQPLDLSHHGITAKHPLIHPHLYNFSSQKPATSMQPQPFQLVDTSPLHLSSSGKVNVYENAKMSLYPRNYDHPDLFQSVNDALQTNSKLDKSAFPSSSVVGKSHTKDQEEETGSSLSKVVCSSQGTRDNMGLYNPAQFSVDAWARQQFMAQQQQNGTLGPVTSTHPSDCCPKHLTQTQRIPSPSSSSSSAIGHAYPHHGTISAAAATLSATQQPLVQPMSPLLGNLQATDPQAFGSLKRASLVDPINGQSLTTPSSQTPLHQHVQHQSSCKKKKGYGDLDRYHQDRGCNLSCMQMRKLKQLLRLSSYALDIFGKIQLQERTFIQNWFDSHVIREYLFGRSSENLKSTENAQPPYLNLWNSQVFWLSFNFSLGVTDCFVSHFFTFLLL